MRLRRIIGLVMTLLLLATAPTAARVGEVEMAVIRLLEFKVIQGQSGLTVELALEKSLTRAELAVIMVRALGREGEVPVAIASAPYPDVPADQWYGRWVSSLQGLAAERGLALGNAEGNFEPDRPVTRAEALVLMLKLLGRSPAGTGAPWHAPWIDLAAELQILLGSEVTSLKSGPVEPIARWEAFLYLDRILSMPLLDGKVAYDTILDKTPPVLVMNSDPRPETVQFQEWLAGTVRDNRGIASITANGVPVTVEANGWFVSEPIRLQIGPNNLQLRIVDRAGNLTVRNWTVNRSCCFAARTEHALYPQFPRKVRAGERVWIDLKLYDENGKLLPPAPYRLVTEMGREEDGWFIASTKAGKGGIEIWTMNLQEAFPIEIIPGPPQKLVRPTVKAVQETYLQAADQYGNPIMGGAWRPMSNGISIDSDGLFVAKVPGRYFVGFWLDGFEYTLSVDVE